jgi:hypothetical protein
MSKYDPLWHHIAALDGDTVTLSFDQIEQVLGLPIDHSFLHFKKELAAYGWQVGPISLKNQTVRFTRLPS